MEKERRIKSLSVVALIVAVLGLTVAFAALSQTLTINGSAKLDASKWGLKFDNLVLASAPLPNSDYIEGEANIKTEDNTVIENMNVKLKTPGDKVVYKVDLVNEGSINAKIDEIVKTTTPDYISFKVYKGNTGNDELKEGYVLGKETSIPLRIEIEFKKNITKEDLPTEARTIGLSYALTFVQTDEDATSIGQTPSSACTTFEKKDTYSVGDEIALCNNDTNKSEDFYVISDNGDKVTALAKYNLLVGTYSQLNLETGEEEYIPLSETEEGYGLQSERAKGVSNPPEDLLDGLDCSSPESDDFSTCVERYNEFLKNQISIVFSTEDKNNGYGYWADTTKLIVSSKYETSYPDVFDENSLLYEPLNNYESYIKTTLGKTSVSASLLTYEQATSLGCDKDNYTCEAAPSWVYLTSYWLGSAYEIFNVWGVKSYGGFDSYSFSTGHLGYDGIFGLRPVITISKTDL